ncbi:MAG: HdeD family acid-resistance protein [Burkholderiaceae bacterium]
MPDNSGLRAGTELRLLEGLADNWWLMLLRGLAAIVFGMLTFGWPTASIVALAMVWGAYALVDGVLALWAGVVGRTTARMARWWLATVGAMGIIAGGLALVWPGITAMVLMFFLAGWLFIVGILQVWGAIRIRKEVEGEIWLALSGLLSIGIALLLVVQPSAALLATAWLIGAVAILVGISYIALGFRLRRALREVGGRG